MGMLWLFLGMCAVAFAFGIPVLIITIKDAKEEKSKRKPVRCYRWSWR